MKVFQIDVHTYFLKEMEAGVLYSNMQITLLQMRKCGGYRITNRRAPNNPTDRAWAPVRHNLGYAFLIPL